MTTERKKLNFKTLTEGKVVTVIKRSDIAEANKAIKVKMKAVVRDYRKREAHSIRDASKLVLNT